MQDRLFHCHDTKKDRMNEPLLYNSRIINTYIKLLRLKYSYVDVDDLLRYAGMELYQVEDEGHWFSQAQVDLFYERLVLLTGNSHIAREAGRFAISTEGLGVMRQYVLGMVDPANVYRMVDKATINFTRSSTYRSRRLSSNRVEITVVPHPGVEEKPFQCDNRIGYFEAIALAFSYRLPHIEHPECLFRGDGSCRYIVTWRKSRATRCKKLSLYASVFLFAFCLAVPLTFPAPALITVLPASLTLILLLHLVAVYLEKKELRTGIENLWELNERLLEQIGINYNNARLASEIGQVLSRQLGSEQMLASVIRILQDRLDYDRGMILLTNPEKDKLLFQTGFGYDEELTGLMRKTSFHLDRPESRDIFVLAFRERKPFLVNDFDQIKSSLSPHSLAIAKRLGAQSFIVCPIVCEGDPLGVLVVDNLQTKKPLIQSDMSLLMGIATTIGISIRNAMLHGARELQFSSILQVLAASIDTRDNLTAGHAEKVTEYALGICQELGLTKDYSEMIRVASLLHDYGKIGIPDSILKKDGRLTEEEYAQVKSHVDKTREILERINFEGIYRQVPEIAGSHHEKNDGSGYPRGLKGSEIPFGAKIIAVADFFEAITAKRHYRDPMPFPVAVRLLEERSGTLFEKAVVSALLSHLEKKADFPPPEVSGKASAREVRSRRVPCRTSVSCRLNGRTVTGVSRDISTKGMYVAVADDVEQGSRIALTFSLPGDCPVKLQIEGRVAWVNSGRKRAKPVLPEGFGVEFLAPAPDGDLVRSYVGTYAAASGMRLFEEAVVSPFPGES